MLYSSIVVLFFFENIYFMKKFKGFVKVRGLGVDLARPADQDMYLTQLPSYEYRYLVGFIYLFIFYSHFFFLSFLVFSIVYITYMYIYIYIWYILRRLDRVRLFLFHSFLISLSLFRSRSLSLSHMNHRFFISFRAACRAASVFERFFFILFYLIPTAEFLFFFSSSR